MINMSDLIISFNIPESIEQKRLVIEFYDGSIRVTKSGLFSGPLRKVSINGNLSFDNIGEANQHVLSSIIRNKRNSKVYKNKYSLVVGIEEIINVANFTSAFAFMSDKKYHLIKHYHLNYTSEYRIEYINDSLFIDIASEDNFEDIVDSQLKTVEPVCKLFIDLQGTDITGTIKFDYNGTIISPSNKAEIIETEDGNVMRNKLFEEEAIAIIRETGFIFSTNDTNKFSKSASISAALSRISDRGILLFSSKGSKISTISSKNISVSYDIDWFSIKVTVESENGFIEISDKIDLKSKFVEIDGKTFVIPDALQNKKIKKDEQGLIISKTDYINALYIASQSSNKEITNINMFFNSDDTIKIPDDIASILRPYQIEGVIWLERMYKAGLGACLADDMGLGKTIQAISVLKIHSGTNHSAPKLVIAPKSLLYNWEKEINKFASNISVIIYHGNARTINEKDLNSNTVFLTTYGTTLNDLEILRQISFDIVVIDEIQFIKNYNSKTFKAIACLKRNMTIGLSGTPFENNITELWSIMNILNNSIFKSKTTFIIMSNLEEFKKINKMISPFVLRREKKDVLKDLPEKNETVLEVKMEQSQEQLYNSLRIKILDEIKKLPSRYEIKTSADILKGLILLRQAACHPLLLASGMNPEHCTESAKFELLKDRVISLVCANEKVIIFSQFTSMLRIIEDWLKDKEIKYYYLDGQTNHRQELVDNFENSNEGVFLISLKAGGVGLNLASCHYVILYDPWWNPATEKQAADRVYRIGQTKDVFVYKLITRNTIEEKIQQLQEKKTFISDSIFKDIGDFKKLDIDEIISLISE